jgi:hypothetical protein
VSKEALDLSGRVVMSPIPEPTPDEFDKLWRDLLGTARRRGPLHGYDAEDLAAEALLHVVAEPEPTAQLPLLQRARVKLRDRRSEILRFRSRRLEPIQFESLDTRPDVPLGDDAIVEFEVLETLSATIGGDARELAECMYEGMTLADVATLPGWDKRRVERARKALKRGKKRALREILGNDDRGDVNTRGD